MKVAQMQIGRRPAAAPRRADLVRAWPVRAWVVAVGLAALALPACVPVYYDAGYIEAAEASKRPRTRPKANVPAPVPVPKAALLTPQKPPDCGEAMTSDSDVAAADPKRTGTGTTGGQASATDVTPNAGVEPADRNAVMAMRIQLEYERECYRKAEERVRARLQELQGSVTETIKSVNQAEKHGE